jgi:hypothetical protein
MHCPKVQFHKVVLFAVCKLLLRRLCWPSHATFDHNRLAKRLTGNIAGRYVVWYFRAIPALTINEKKVLLTALLDLLERLF